MRCDNPVLGELLLDAPTVMGVESIEVDTVTLRVVARTLPGKQFEAGRQLRVLVIRALDRAGIVTDGRRDGRRRRCRRSRGPGRSASEDESAGRGPVRSSTLNTLRRTATTWTAAGRATCSAAGSAPRPWC